MEKHQSIINKMPNIQEVKERPSSPQVGREGREHMFSKSFSAFPPGVLGSITPRDKPANFEKAAEELPDYVEPS